MQYFTSLELPGVLVLTFKKVLMKHSILFILLCVPFLTQAHIISVKEVDKGLYVMYYDTTGQKRIVTKSTIVEFKTYIALIEMPISNDGAGTKHLQDYTEGGEEVLKVLKEHFPKKPLKYVLSTHWHPHSISSVLPFISRGITVFTTQKNFKRLNQFVDSVTYAKYKSFISFINTDGVVLKDHDNEIVAYRLDKKDYLHIPTDDFVFYYLPRYNILHNSCMFQRFAGYKVMDKELVSSRVDDLFQLIAEKQLDPDYLITTDTYWDGVNGTVSGDTLRTMRNKGITMGTLEKQLLSVDEATFITKADSVMKYLMDHKIPYSIVNTAIYTLLKKHELSKALAVARLQALLNPSDPNVWDTYGEVYYFLGDKKMAEKYHTQCLKVDKEFTSGGPEVWQEDLESYQQMW